MVGRRPAMIDFHPAQAPRSRPRAGAAARPARRTADGTAKGRPAAARESAAANEQRAHVAGIVAGLALVNVLKLPERQKVEWWDGVRR
jgi:hypothetical protein